MKWVFFIACLFYAYSAAATTITLEKRQAVPSRACAGSGNSRAVCSPSPDDVWYNGTHVQLEWNLNNAAFTSSSSELIDFYLLYYQNDNFEAIKTWSNLPLSQGVLVEVIDDSWYPSQLPQNSENVTLHPYAYVVNAGTDFRAEIDKGDQSYVPPPVRFTLIQNAPSTNAVVPKDDASAASGPGKSESGGLKPWMIGVIVAACVIFVAAIVALVWLLRRLRKNRAESAALGDQRTLINNNQSRDGDLQRMSLPGAMAGSINNASSTGLTDNMSSIYSSTPMVFHSGSQRIPAMPNSPSSPKSMKEYDLEKHSMAAHMMQNPEARQSSSILSSTDALMIADTFRKFMRKPEWTEREDDDESVALQNDDLLRKQPLPDASTLQPPPPSLTSQATRLKHVTTPSDYHHSH